MKRKLFLLVFTLLLALPLHAQWYVGGAAGVSANFKDHYYGIDLRPDVGYAFDKVSVGVALSISHIGSQGEVSSRSLGLTPYVQYYVWSSEVLSIFLEGGCTYSWNSFQDMSPYHCWEPYLSPGLEISISDHWSAVGYIGKLGYDSYLRSIDFNLDASAFQVGLYYSF